MKYQRVLLIGICILFAWSCSFPKPRREYKWRFVRFAGKTRFPYHVWQKTKPYCAYASIAMYLQVIIEGFKDNGQSGKPDLDAIANLSINSKVGVQDQGIDPYQARTVLALFIRHDHEYGRERNENEKCPFGMAEDTVGDVRINQDADAEDVFQTLSKSLDINKRMAHFIDDYYHRRRGIYVSFRNFRAISNTGSNISGAHAVYAYGIYRDEKDKLEYDDADDVVICVANPQVKKGTQNAIMQLEKELLEDFNPRAVIYDQGIQTVRTYKKNSSDNECNMTTKGVE